MILYIKTVHGKTHAYFAGYCNYRSILSVTIALGPLNLITGPNGSGKSNLYKALRLLAQTASGGVIHSLADEGGLHSTFWAGPEEITGAMRRGEAEIQGGPRKDVVRLKLGFASETFGYTISLGLPEPQQSAFCFDPEIKRECIFNGPYYRPASALVDRKGNVVKIRSGRQWEVVSQHVPSYDSMFDAHADPSAAAEVFHVREMIRSWRFYDHFRTDSDAPARKPQLVLALRYYTTMAVIWRLRSRPSLKLVTKRHWIAQ